MYTCQSLNFSKQHPRQHGHGSTNPFVCSFMASKNIKLNINVYILRFFAYHEWANKWVCWALSMLSWVCLLELRPWHDLPWKNWRNYTSRYCRYFLFTWTGYGACTRVGTLIVATIYLLLIQNRYMFRSFTVLQCSHQYCVQPVASDVEVVGYL